MAQNQFSPTRYGIASGLAQKIDYDVRYQRDQYLYQLEKQLKTENQVKVDSLSSLQQVKKFGTPYIDGKLEELAEQNSEKIGEIISKYGDPFRSPEAMRQIKLIGADFQDNEWVREGERLKTDVESLYQDYRSGAIDKEEFDSFYQGYLSYVQKDGSTELGGQKEKWFYSKPDRTTELLILSDILSKYTQQSKEDPNTGITKSYWSQEQLDQMFVDSQSSPYLKKFMDRRWAKHCSERGLKVEDVDAYRKFIGDTMKNLKPDSQSGHYQRTSNNNNNGNSASISRDPFSQLLVDRTGNSGSALLKLADVDANGFIRSFPDVNNRQFVSAASNGSKALNFPVYGSARPLSISHMNDEGTIPYGIGQVAYNRNDYIAGAVNSLRKSLKPMISNPNSPSMQFTISETNYPKFITSTGFNEDDIRSIITSLVNNDANFINTVNDNDSAIDPSIKRVIVNELVLGGPNSKLAALISAYKNNPADSSQRVEAVEQLNEYVRTAPVRELLNGGVTLNGNVLLSYILSKGTTVNNPSQSDLLSGVDFSHFSSSTPKFITDGIIDLDFSQARADDYNTAQGLNAEAQKKSNYNNFLGVDERIPMATIGDHGYVAGIKNDNGQRTVTNFAMDYRNESKPASFDELVSHGIEYSEKYRENGLIKDLVKYLINSRIYYNDNQAFSDAQKEDGLNKLFNDNKENKTTKKDIIFSPYMYQEMLQSKESVGKLLKFYNENKNLFSKK